MKSLLGFCASCGTRPAFSLYSSRQNLRSDPNIEIIGRTWLIKATQPSSVIHDFKAVSLDFLASLAVSYYREIYRL